MSGIIVSNRSNLNSIRLHSVYLRTQANSNRNVKLALSHRQCFNEIKQFKRYAELGIKERKKNCLTHYLPVKNPSALGRVHRSVKSNESTPVRRTNRRLLRAPDV